MWISDLCIRRPVLAVMMIAALLTLGFISMGRVGIDLFPRVEFPYVSVETTLQGHVKVGRSVGNRDGFTASARDLPSTLDPAVA